MAIRNRRIAAPDLAILKGQTPSESFPARATLRAGRKAARQRAVRIISGQRFAVVASGGVHPEFGFIVLFKVVDVHWGLKQGLCQK